MKKGTHRARPLGAVFSRTQGDSARAYVFIKFGLSSDMTDTMGWSGFFGDNKDKGGKTLTERTMDVMTLCGWRLEHARNLSHITSDHEVEIVVQEEEYRGESQLKVRFVQEVGTAAKFMPPPLPDNEIDFVMASIKRATVGNRGGNPIDRVPGEDDDKF